MIVVTRTGQVIEDPTPGVVPAPTSGVINRPVRASYWITLTGVDGSLWDLNHGPATIMAGTNLFDPPPVTHWRRKAPAVAGARWAGMRTEERSLILPVRIAARTWDDFRDADHAFFKAIAPEGEILLTVTSPDRVVRTIAARWDSDGSGADDTDPLIFGRKQYVLTFTADQPFWRGTPILRPFGLTQVPWLPAEAPGPPMHINAVSSLTSASMPNPGDVPASCRCTITGPATSFRFGIGDNVVSSSIPIPPGGKVIIDSSPTERSIVDGTGGNVYENMTEKTFVDIPTGADVPITLEVTGFGTTTGAVVELTPLYRRLT